MRVLIVDDHPLYREGLKALLSGLDSDLDATDVSTVVEAVALAQTDPPFALVLLDMNLPGANHLTALQQIKAAFESAAVVIVSGEEDPTLILQTIEAGAAGYIPKSTDSAVTIQALRLVLAHGVYLPAHALRHMSSVATHTAIVPKDAPELSERQRAVLRCLLQGKANKVIARELDIAEGTVKAHLWAVYQMLGVNSRAQAMYRAYELGLLGRDGPGPTAV
jgi:DNA-binding NarL/FixJ family response regulator